MQNVLKGKKGEDLAAKYLAQLGYRVLQRNWYCRWGEIDLVAKEGGSIIFVEVKYRSAGWFGDPHQAVNAAKLRALRRSIQRYIYLHKLFDQAHRLDVICIRHEKGKFKLKHYKSVIS